MKVLDTSPIAQGVSFYPKGGTLSFLQLAYQELANAMMVGRIGANYDPTKGYILFGCVNSGSGLNYNISAGAIFFNGEIFLCDGQSFTIVNPNVAEGVITTTQFTANADPSIFSDGIARNVHNIRKIVFQPGLAGSGAFDFVNAINLAYMPQGGIGQAIMWRMPGTGNQNTLLSTYFDGTGLGIHPLTLGWALANGANGTDNYGANAIVGYLAGDAVFGTLGQSQGENEHTLTISEMPTHHHQTDMHSSIAGAGGSIGGQGALNGSNTTDTGGGTAHNNIQVSRTSLIIQRIS